MKKNIPNLITLMNVICGTMSIFMTMYGYLEWAAAFIIFGMIFDFFDGMVARLLHVKSELGKELDSLADIVSFGVAPAIIAHTLIKMTFLGYFGELNELTTGQMLLSFVPLLIPAFSAFRLAKFNLDTRQSLSFIGMPVPAHALFWVSLVLAYAYVPEWYNYLFGNVWVLVICVVILSILLISELAMFSLKISGFAWKQNRVRYIYFICLLILFAVLGFAAVLFIIPLYILFCVVKALNGALRKPCR